MSQYVLFTKTLLDFRSLIKIERFYKLLSDFTARYDYSYFFIIYLVDHSDTAKRIYSFTSEHRRYLESTTTEGSLIICHINLPYNERRESDTTYLLESECSINPKFANEDLKIILRKTLSKFLMLGKCKLL